jgi:hypothetical protein
LQFLVDNAELRIRKNRLQMRQHALVPAYVDNLLECAAVNYHIRANGPLRVGDIRDPIRGDSNVRRKRRVAGAKVRRRVAR